MRRNEMKYWGMVLLKCADWIGMDEEGPMGNAAIEDGINKLLRRAGVEEDKPDSGMIETKGKVISDFRDRVLKEINDQATEYHLINKDEKWLTGVTIWTQFAEVCRTIHDRVEGIRP